MKLIPVALQLQSVLKILSPAIRCATIAEPIILEAIRFPEPVISLAVEPKSRADQDKLGDALIKLSEEDPTFKIRTDRETGQTLISGMGELHLEVLVDRILREYNVSVNVGKPQVAYKETIKLSVESEGRVCTPDRRTWPVRSC